MEIQQLIIADVARTARKMNQQLAGISVPQKHEALATLKEYTPERAAYFEDLRRRAEVGAITCVREELVMSW